MTALATSVELALIIGGVVAAFALGALAGLTCDRRGARRRGTRAQPGWWQPPPAPGRHAQASRGTR